MFQLNDTVCRQNSTGDGFEFGRVLMSIEDFSKPLPIINLQEKVPVMWCNGEFQIIENVSTTETTVGIVSRKFKPGAVVLSLESGKKGYVVAVKEFATLQSAHEPTIIFKDIPCHRLSTIMDFYSYIGAHILYQNWIGMIISTKRRISYSYNNDIFYSIIDNNDNNVQVPPWMDPHWISDGSMVYPGKQFIFNQKMWQQGLFDSVWGKTKSLPLIGKVFVVEDTEVVKVKVQWICPAHELFQNDNWNRNSQPCTEIAGEDLQRIMNVNIPSHLLVTNGSGRIFHSTDEDIRQNLREWKSQFAKDVIPHQMMVQIAHSSGAGASGSGDNAGSSHKNKKAKLDSEENRDLPESNAVGQKENETVKNCHVVKVLFTRQIAHVIFDDQTSEEINSVDLAPITLSRQKESDFPFSFGNWVKRKRNEFYDETDKLYGVVLKSISASKSLVQWTHMTEADLELTLHEECWNFDLQLHDEFNSLQRGIIVLWDSSFCGVVVENISPSLKIKVQKSTGEELFMEPHKLCPITRLGFWDILAQRWAIDHPSGYLLETRMDPFNQTEEIFLERVQFFEHVPITHFYFENNISHNDIPYNFAATIQREFYFLREHLPEGIWVQFYLNRIDLVSAAIRGTKDTPYESLLFFFDIKIPNTYPGSPPQVRFISFGHKDLNPNFNVDGTICSSLLETVKDGVYLERWNSNVSNIMKILLSIQGLYLVEHPLFNTPPYQYNDVTKFNLIPNQISLSKMYDKKISAKLLLYYSSLLRNPPCHWRFLIIANLYSSLDSVLRNMKNVGVIPDRVKDTPNKKDSTTFSNEILVAATHMELVLQDVKENVYQIMPRLSM